MKTVQDEVAFVNMPIPCIPAITRSPGRSTPAAMHDDAPVPGIQSSVISRATREAGSTLYELLGRAELMRVAYEKGDLASVQNRALAPQERRPRHLTSSISAIRRTDETRKRSDGRQHASASILLRCSTTCQKRARSIVGDKPVTVMDVSCPSPVVIYSDPVNDQADHDESHEQCGKVHRSRKDSTDPQQGQR